MLSKRTDLIYSSTKTYTHSVGLSTCFRQHKADSHCRYLHGYALEVRFTFTAYELDENNWVVDFGSLKPIKAWLEDTFDHKLLVASDDPRKNHLYELCEAGLGQLREVPACGCEAFARMIYEHTEAWLLAHSDYGTRVLLESVEVKEHQGNSALVRSIRNGL